MPLFISIVLDFFKFNKRKTSKYKANFDFLKGANTSCCRENDEQHWIKILNLCVFIRNRNTIDYYEKF